MKVLIVLCAVVAVSMAGYINAPGYLAAGPAFYAAPVHGVAVVGSDASRVAAQNVVARAQGVAAAAQGNVAAVQGAGVLPTVYSAAPGHFAVPSYAVSGADVAAAHLSAKAAFLG